MQLPISKSEIKLPQGLLGFPDDVNWKLEASDVEPFFRLKSLDTKGLEFLLLDPFLVCPDYEIDVDDKTLQEIGILSPCDIAVLTIITMSSDTKAVTTNLAGPIILNKKTGAGLQAVTADPRWNTKYSIIRGMQKKEKLPKDKKTLGDVLC